MTETITTKQGISPLWGRVTEAIYGTVKIAPSAYVQLTGGYQAGGVASDNWDEVGAALDLMNLAKHFPSSAPLPVIADFLRRKLADKRFGQKEFGSWIYLGLHVDPTLVQYAYARQFGARDPAWAEIADGLRGWLRAAVGWLAVTGCWGPGRTWAPSVKSSGPGAKLLVGRGDYNGRISGAVFSALCGKRSWENDGGEWFDSIWAPLFLADIGLGRRDLHGDVGSGHRKFLVAVESVLGHPLDILGADEQALVLAATRNDIAALQWCVSDLIRDWLPSELVQVTRSEHGVSCTMLRAGKAPTATMYHCGWVDDGTVYAAGACNGLRGGHAEMIEPGMAAVDMVLRTGYCQRTDGPERVRVAFPLPTGPLVAVLTAQHGFGMTPVYYRSGVVITPAPLPGVTPPPAPRPPKRKKKWWEFWR